MPDSCAKTGGADNRFGRRNRSTRCRGDKFGEFRQARQINPRLECCPGTQRGGDLLERGIARPLTQSKHGDAGMRRPAADRRKGIRRRQTEVVMSVKFKREFGFAAQLVKHVVGLKRIEHAERISEPETIGSRFGGGGDTWRRKSKSARLEFLAADRHRKAVSARIAHDPAQA